MNRLFIKIKTDPKLPGTLMEIKGENSIGDTIDQIVTLHDFPLQSEEGVPYNYDLILLGSPKRQLKKKKDFVSSGVKNSDIVLLTTNSDAFLKGNLFNFLPLNLMSQEDTIQDLRAPLRPLSQFEIAKANSQPKSQDHQAKTEENDSAKKEDSPSPSFDFQPLDIDFTESE